MPRLKYVALLGASLLLLMYSSGYPQSCLPVSQPTPSPTPTGPIQPFVTLGPNATLPSGATCTALVDATPSTELMPTNENDGTGYNSNVPPAGGVPSYFYTYAGGSAHPASDFSTVDGNFSGTTESIFRWAACKWGIDELLIRAQSWTEHMWHEDCPMLHGGSGCNEVGDLDSPNGCLLNLPVTSITPGGKFCALQGIGGAAAGHQYASWSLLQTKVAQEWYTWPMLAYSAPFAVDYHYATTRGCLNGDQFSYYNSQNPASGANYQAAVTAATNNPLGSSSVAGETNLGYLIAGCTETHYTGAWGSGDWNPATNPTGYYATIVHFETTQPWGTSSPPA